MSAIQFHALSPSLVDAWRRGEMDANGLPPEIHHATSGDLPCRACLQPIQPGEDYMILAHRPFPTLHPYAELGPIFVHAGACAGWRPSEDPPAMFLAWEQLLLKGYDESDRIVYGTGQIVPTDAVKDAARAILDDARVRYVHVRSARNNCYMARIDRAL